MRVLKGFNNVAFELDVTFYKVLPLVSAYVFEDVTDVRHMEDPCLFFGRCRLKHF